jgi:glutamine synthetase
MLFVDTHGLWTDAQRAVYAELLERLKNSDVEVIRSSFPD